MKRIKIGSRSFNSIKSAKLFFYDNFKKYHTQWGNIATFIPWKGTDKDILISFLQHSSKWKDDFNDALVGQELTFGDWRPAVRLNQEITYFGFGSTWKQMFNSENYKTEKFCMILRNTLQTDLMTFRDEEFAKGDVICIYTNELLIPTTCHVDHAETPFKDIAQQFLEYIKSNNLTIDDFKIKRIVKDVPILDEPDAQLWKDFHNERATLQIISISANLSKGSRQKPFINKLTK